MTSTEQIPLDKPFSETSPEFKEVARNYFYKMLPVLMSEFKALQTFGIEASLEAYELLVEEGGIRIVQTTSGDWKLYLFNLFTGIYEDITVLKEDLEEDDDEDFGY